MIIDRSFVLPPDKELSLVAKNNVIIHLKILSREENWTDLMFYLFYEIFAHSFLRELDGAILHLWVTARESVQ